MQNSFEPSQWNTSPTGIQWTFLSKGGLQPEFSFLFLFIFMSYDLIFNTFIFLFQDFLSYESRKLSLESELSANPNPSNSCGCAPSDGSFPKASDPTCEFVRRWEVFKFLWWVIYHTFIEPSIFMYLLFPFVLYTLGIFQILNPLLFQELLGLDCFPDLREASTNFYPNQSLRHYFCRWMP